MNKYTELSDFEINKKVAGHYLPCDYNLNEHTKTVELIGFLGDTDEYNVYGTFDPCNNAKQAWEIMLKYNICVIKELHNDFSAYKDLIVGYGDCEASYSYGSYHKKPFAAAMLAFLLMKDAENEGWLRR